MKNQSHSSYPSKPLVKGLDSDNPRIIYKASWRLYFIWGFSFSFLMSLAALLGLYSNPTVSNFNQALFDLWPMHVTILIFCFMTGSPWVLSNMIAYRWVRNYALAVKGRASQQSLMDFKFQHIAHLANLEMCNYTHQDWDIYLWGVANNIILVRLDYEVSNAIKNSPSRAAAEAILFGTGNHTKIVLEQRFVERRRASQLSRYFDYPISLL